MNTVKVGRRGIITLPKKMRDALAITEGGILGVREEGGALVLEPHRSPHDAILADIRKGLREIQCGEYIEFTSILELHKKAKRYAN